MAGATTDYIRVFMSSSRLSTKASYKSRPGLSLCLLMALSHLSPLIVIGPHWNLKEGAEMHNSLVITRIKECEERLGQAVQRHFHE